MVDIKDFFKQPPQPTGRTVIWYYTYDFVTKESVAYTALKSAEDLALKWAKDRNREIWVVMIQHTPSYIRGIKIKSVYPNGNKFSTYEVIFEKQPSYF